MTRAILSINFGHVLCSNSRESMLEAAARWRAEFIEIDENYFLEHHMPAVPHPAALLASIRTIPGRSGHHRYCAQPPPASRVRLGGTVADSFVVRGLATGVDSGMDAFRGATGDLKQ